MGLVAMSLKDLQRIEVLTEVLGGGRTASSAAAVLGLSLRQTHRLLVRYGDGGGGALIHQASGKASNNQLDPGVREYVLELIRRRYRDFGPTLAAEALLGRHGISGGRSLEQCLSERVSTHRSTTVPAPMIVTSERIEGTVGLLLCCKHCELKCLLRRIRSSGI